MLSNAQKQSLEQSTLQYASHLEEAEGYLKGRGIGLEVARSVGLGVVRDPLPGHERLEGRLAIPYLTDFGPVNMTFRCLRDHDCKSSGCPKYLLWEGLESNIYSVQSLKYAGDWIAVTEGEIDALSLNIAGVPAVGIAGASKWREHWSNVFEDFSKVYVIQEGDSAGKKFADMLVREVGAMRVVLPSKEDSNSLLVKYGPEALKARIRI